MSSGEYKNTHWSFFTPKEKFANSWQMNKLQATVYIILFEQSLSCSSWNTAALQSTSASSWDAGCWCGHTSSCGSWRHGGADGRNTWERTSSLTHDPSPSLDVRSEACALTCGRSSCRSCISGPAVWETARWCLLGDAAPGGGWTLPETTNISPINTADVTNVKVQFTHLSECCSLKACDRLPTACQRKSDAAGQEGCLRMK